MGISLKEAVATAPSFYALYEFYNLKEGIANVSFWGTRCVHVKNHKGSISLDDLSSRVLKLVKENIEFDESERAYGKLLVEKIDGFYSETDVKIERKNLVTKLFFAIKEYWVNNCENWGYSRRFDWFENGSQKRFYYYYTAGQYQKVFHRLQPTDIMSRSMRSGFPDRWLAPTSH